jgi:predicted component of type VI protein secretion system
MQSDFTADDLATVLEIVLAQDEEIARLTSRLTLAEGAAREADARCRKLETKLDAAVAGFEARLLRVEVPRIREHYAAAERSSTPNVK